jgi:hypothetical protein
MNAKRDVTAVGLTLAVQVFCNDDREMDQTRHFGDLDVCRATDHGTGHIV